MVALEGLLGRLASVLVVACVLTVAATGVAIAVPQLRERLKTPEAPAYVVGQHVDLPASVYGGSPYTLLILARSNCGACQRAAPLFAALIADLKSRSDIGVRLVTRRVRSDELRYAAAIGLDEANVVLTDLTSLRVERVPTLLLVDRGGRVLLAHEGAPASSTEFTSFIHSATQATPSE
jgi:hypothetical protein